MSYINYLLEHKWAFLTLIGALVVAFGAFKSSTDQANSEKKAKVLQKELTKKTIEISDLQKITIQLQQQNIVELTHQRNLITGGNSFPSIQLIPGREKPYIYKPQLFHGGQYPLFKLDIKIKYVRGNNLGKELDINIDEFKQGSIKTFPPELVFDLKKDPNLALEIIFNARNGSWKEEINFRKTEKGEYQREIIFRTQYGQKEPIFHTKFEDKNSKIGSMLEGIKSLEQHYNTNK
ncbi:hypothetical protein [Tenacibaculum discolor]|uniref:hypothetical protein n=1 Tax=Tenacibaculum discolor TaxID=361581 RepID=UPI003F799A69